MICQAFLYSSQKVGEIGSFEIPFQKEQLSNNRKSYPERVKVLGRFGTAWGPVGLKEGLGKQACTIFE